jgi:multiple antibiotic resistance protein
VSGAQDLIHFDLKSIFTIFFIMLGPLKVIAPFAKLTAGRPQNDLRPIALNGIWIATLTVLIASLIGSSMLAKWNVAIGALAIAAGILFFLVALRLVLDPYTEGSAPAGTPPAEKPPANVVVSKLVPAIVSPWGIAAVIFFLTVEPEMSWPIIAMLVLVMLIDLVAMLFARQVLRVFAFPLQLIGTVMGVLQVALSVEIIILGIKLVAIQRFGAHFTMGGS